MGFKSTPPPDVFICENNRKDIRLCNVLVFFLSGSFEDMGIFHVFIYIGYG